MKITDLLYQNRTVLRQAASGRRTERDALLFEPRFVGVSADPTGSAQKDRGLETPDQELGQRNFPVSKLKECSELWNLILNYSSTHPQYVSEAARTLLVLESLTDEQNGNLRNVHHLGGNLEEN
jgi:hypothetical protein